ncbi:MAG: type II toxin-antitoxin system RelE/ParE family toxin [Gammaproteobacteria bacterium]|nr:type II toxin-antitoxin system RelE/ParE family toxin [Gammaproteobacteria bacterium]
MVTTIYRYQIENGREPVTVWLERLRDRTASAAIRMRLRRIEAGNFGDCKSVGDGVAELRVDVGAGYRVYYAMHGRDIVILLCGGDKRTQDSDIQMAKRYWAEFKRRNA